MDMIWKTFRAELKEPDEDGSLNMFIPVSTASIDRDSEVIEPSAFKKTIPKFMKHPVLVASHDYRDLTNQIGEWTKLKITDDGKGIEGKPKYYIGMGNDQADWAYKLAQKGVAAFSIGFIPTKWEDGDGVKSAKRTYQEVELLEISQVIIPSNRDAVMSMRSKSVDPVINQLIEDIVNAPIVDLTETEENEIITKPEETNDFIRIPVDRGNHEGHRIRTIDISEKEGIKALYCGTDKVIITYLFDKSKWTMERAKQWVKEHEGKGIEPNQDDGIEIESKHPEPQEVSQKELLDEIDYLRTLLKNAGRNEAVTESLNTFFQVEEKQGAVLNKKNKDKLAQIKTLAQEVLDSAGIEEEEEKRNPGNDIPVEEKNKEESSANDILEAIQNANIGGN